MTTRAYENQSALVLGAARSGRAAASLLRRLGASVVIYDRDSARLEDLQGSAKGAPRAGWTDTCSGPHAPDFAGFDLVVRSPGIPATEAPEMRHVLPEVDLAARHLTGRLIGITGTNGKSTVTVLTGEMLRAHGLRIGVGGNLGTPLSALAEQEISGPDAAPFDWVVAELSSFQLEHARELRPRVGVLLNLSEDHLDRHGTLEAYGSAKAKLVGLQGKSDTLVVNLDDPWASAQSERAPGDVLGFSCERDVERGASFRSNRFRICPDGATAWLELGTNDLSRAVRVHPPNALAAALAAARAGIDSAAARKVLASFAGLPHRSELVCERRGVSYVNDSKATNPAAALASVRAEAAKCIWLLGGQNKGLDFTLLREASSRVRAAVVYGQAAEEIARDLAGVTEIVRVEGLRDAVLEACRRAQPGDVVLLAPACASHDQFSSFEERGHLFAALVRELPC